MLRWHLMRFWMRSGKEAPAWGHLDAGQSAVRDWLEYVLAAEDPIVPDVLLVPSTRTVFV